MTILDLPNEIIIKIIGCLDESKDFARCSLVSRYFQAIALPFLFGDVDTRSSWAWRQSGDLQPQLYVTLSTRPTTARLVKSLTVDLKLKRKVSSFSLQRLEKQDAQVTLRKLVRSVAEVDDSGHPWLQDDSLRPEALIGSVLSILPNLKHLDIFNVSPAAGYLWSRGFRQTVDGKPWPNHFQMLSTIRISASFDASNDHEDDLGLIRLLFRLPSLKSLHADNFLFKLPGTGRPLLPRTSRVKDIALTRLIAPPEVIDEFIAATEEELDSLELNFSPSLFLDPEFVPDLMTSIGRVQATLINFELTWDCQSGIDRSSLAAFPKMSTFNHVEKYGLSTRLIFGGHTNSRTHTLMSHANITTENLPPNIRSLKLVHHGRLFDESTIAFIDQVIAMKSKGGLTALQTIDLHEMMMMWIPQTEVGKLSYTQACLIFRAWGRWWRDDIFFAGMKPTQRHLVPGPQRAELRGLWKRAKAAGLNLVASTPWWHETNQEKDWDPFGLLDYETLP